MREYGFHNWESGEVAIETVVTEIAVYSRYLEDRHVQLVGRVDLAVVEAIQRALADDVTAMNSGALLGVDSRAHINVSVTAYGAPAADGSRRESRSSHTLPADVTDAEVAKVSAALAKIAGAKLALPLGKFSRVV